MGPLLIIFILFWRVKTQEISTVSSLLKPRNFNHHAFNTEQFLTDLNLVEPTKQGPVLFPNDAPPPPPPPLVVTSRPLLESIARSELAENNTVTSQSQSRVSFVPFLARVKDYRPFAPSPTFAYQFVPTQVPYADVVKKSRYNSLERDNRYNDYEERAILPPIYKALSDHAKQKVLKVREKQNIYQTVQPSYADHPDNNDINEENSEYDKNQNYAFSYTVKDHNTGDDFSHSQHSSGSATNGQYRVRLPDGRMQIVSYTADENGYKADVRYDDDKNTIDDYTNYKPNDYSNKDYIPKNTVSNKDYNFNNVGEAGNTNFNNVGERINTNYNNVGESRNDYVNYNDYNKYKVNFVTPIYARPTQNYQNNKDNFNTPAYAKPTQSYLQDYKNDYTDRSSKYDKKENDYQYPDTSKEYYNDYSTEYNSHTEPHRSKFNFVEVASTVKPSYDELKELFVTKDLYNTEQKYDEVTTPIFNDITTERVVLIGNKKSNLYTNIKQILPNFTPFPVTYATPKVIEATTPRSYLVSTIASLRNKVHLAKPVLSDNFISRINKYINLK